MLNQIRSILPLVFSRSASDRLKLRSAVREVPLLSSFVRKVVRVKARLSQRDSAAYLKMQRSEYELLSAADEVTAGDIKGDYVAGSWREHDAWPDYEEYLMKYVPSDSKWTAIEYGCGPGRNIRRWSSRFQRIDGVDISATNLAHVKQFVSGLIESSKMPNLYVTEGMNCGKAPLESYDFAFSTICLQHICVHEVRTSIFKSLFDCLKPGGRLSAQMGFGTPSPCCVPYKANLYSASETNRGCDVEVASASQLEDDLCSLGYTQFEFWIGRPGQETSTQAGYSSLRKSRPSRLLSIL